MSGDGAASLPGCRALRGGEAREVSYLWTRRLFPVCVPRGEVMNSPVGFRARALLVTGIAVCGLAWAAFVGLHVANAAAPAIPPGTLQVSGSAFGTHAFIGDTAKASTTAPVGFGGGCSLNGQQLPIHVQNRVASVSIP